MEKSENTGKKSKQEKRDEKTGVKDRRKLMIITGIVVIVAAAVILAFFQFNPAVVNKGEVTKGENVSVYYTGIFDNGTVFGTNLNSTPMEVTVGSPALISGFSNALIGMKVNQEKIVTVPFDQAYGPYNSSLIHTVNRTGQLANITLDVGKYYDIFDRKENTVSRIRIIDVTNSTVTWDENNPLAGQNLTFTIQVVGINP